MSIFPDLGQDSKIYTISRTGNYPRLFKGVPLNVYYTLGALSALNKLIQTIHASLNLTIKTKLRVKFTEDIDLE